MKFLSAMFGLPATTLSREHKDMLLGEGEYEGRSYLQKMYATGRFLKEGEEEPLIAGERTSTFPNLRTLTQMGYATAAPDFGMTAKDFQGVMARDEWVCAQMMCLLLGEERLGSINTVAWAKNEETLMQEVFEWCQLEPKTLPTSGDAWQYAMKMGLRRFWYAFFKKMQNSELYTHLPHLLLPYFITPRNQCTYPPTPPHPKNTLYPPFVSPFPPSLPPTLQPRPSTRR